MQNQYIKVSWVRAARPRKFGRRIFASIISRARGEAWHRAPALGLSSKNCHFLNFSSK
jgi:hypothetical protein